MSNSALASLTAQYTDSENEDELQGSPDSDDSQASQVIFRDTYLFQNIYKQIYTLRLLYHHRGSLRNRLLKKEIQRTMNQQRILSKAKEKGLKKL